MRQPKTGFKDRLAAAACSAAAAMFAAASAAAAATSNTLLYRDRKATAYAPSRPS